MAEYLRRMDEVVVTSLKTYAVIFQQFLNDRQYEIGMRKQETSTIMGHNIKN
jgi:uncharacterized protein YqgQ